MEQTPFEREWPFALGHYVGHFVGRVHWSTWYLLGWFIIMVAEAVLTDPR